MEVPGKAIEHLTEIEDKAQDILTDREEIVALDKLRNQNREGMRALKKGDDCKTWVTVGPLLVKMPINVASDHLGKEQVKLDTKINQIRSDLKVKVNALRDLEHEAPVPGLMLDPMTRNEMDAMGQVLGANVRR